MRDPVLLPASKVIVDMSTIKGHLLSDPTDPFSRIPLRVEDVVPRTLLRIDRP
jgi:ubiquitin conjugation factor E4 B